MKLRLMFSFIWVELVVSICRIVYLDNDLFDDVVGDFQFYLGIIRNEYLDDDLSDLFDDVVEDNQFYLGYIRGKYLKNSIFCY